MAPRGTTSPTASRSHPDPTDAEINTIIDATSSSALTTAKRNLRFVIDPTSTPNAPSRLRTRALLRSLRYITIFVFWRVVRYAKYAAVGALAAAVGATAFGSVVSGLGWLLAPPTMTASLGLGALWMVGKWGVKRARRRMEKGREREVEVGMDWVVPEPRAVAGDFA